MLHQVSPRAWDLIFMEIINEKGENSNLDLDLFFKSTFKKIILVIIFNVSECYACI